MPNKDVVAKYEAAKNVISTWVKNKCNIWPSLLEGQNVKRENHRTRVHEALDTAVFKWFLNIKSQKAPLLDPIIREKESIHIKELSIEHFKRLDGWLRRRDK